DVHGVGEGEAELLHELPRRLVLVLDVDTDQGNAALLVVAPGLLEHGRLLVAGGDAPRGPEVHHDHAAAQTLQGYRRAREGGERERRRRPADEGRLPLALGVRPEARAARANTGQK